MERKSQFLLWLETLFLKLDFLNTVHELLLQESVPGQVLGGDGQGHLLACKIIVGFIVKQKNPRQKA